MEVMVTVGLMRRVVVADGVESMLRLVERHAAPCVALAAADSDSIIYVVVRISEDENTIIITAAIGERG